MDYKDEIIKNVFDYLLWVKKTNSVEIEKSISLEHGNGYYRGQACSYWELKPSVLRDSLRLDEHSLLKKATLRLWNEIRPLGSYLEKMIFFQHYGLSTRLLDVTFNPLIALYMACYEKRSGDGAVYCGYQTDNQNPKIAELTAKYVFENEVQRIIFDFQSFTKKEGVDVNMFLQPIFILPPINNPRMEAQNGAFIMAPLIEKIIDENTAHLNINDFNKYGIFDNRRAIIPEYAKESILQELFVLGIDGGSIYKCIEAKLKAIVAEEKWASNKI